MRRFTHNWQTNWNKKFSRYIPILAVVVVFGGLGTALLVASHAATPALSVESESGTISSLAAAVNDATASGSKAIKFGSGSTGGGTVPAQCASGGTYLWSNLATCGWPAPSNTGYILSDCGGSLKASTLTADSHGVINVTAANQNISCQTINGCVHVATTGVTFKDDLVSACDGTKLTSDSIMSSDNVADGIGAITFDVGASGTVSQTEINGLDRVHSCIWHDGVSMSANAVNCYGIDDGVFSWAQTNGSGGGQNTTVQNSYFHDFTTKTANGHIDGYQTEGTINGLINHNTYLMTSDDDNSTDSAVALWDSQESTNNVVVSNNLITGGGFAMYAEDYSPSEASPSGGFSETNVSFTNNSFSTHLFGGTCVGFYGVWYPRGNPTDKWNRSGNKVLETGVNLDNGNPNGCN